jgi:hypothetical protein
MELLMLVLSRNVLMEMGLYTYGETEGKRKDTTDC